MEEIPGLDNYGATLHDEAFGYPAFDLNAKNSPNEPKKNVAYYHR